MLQSVCPKVQPINNVHYDTLQPTTNLHPTWLPCLYRLLNPTLPYMANTLPTIRITIAHTHLLSQPYPIKSCTTPHTQHKTQRYTHHYTRLAPNSTIYPPYTQVDNPPPPPSPITSLVEEDVLLCNCILECSC